VAAVRFCYTRAALSREAISVDTFPGRGGISGRAEGACLDAALVALTMDAEPFDRSVYTATGGDEIQIVSLTAPVGWRSGAVLLLLFERMLEADNLVDRGQVCGSPPYSPGS